MRGDVELFLAQRQARWRRLEELLDHADAVPPSSLGPDVLQELVVLYRQACSDLNRARALTANPDVLGVLNRLTGRAYRVVHGTGRRPVDLWRAVQRFFAETAPRTLRQERAHVLAALASLVAGAVLGLLAVLADPQQAAVLVPQEFFESDVGERAERIEQSPERIRDAGAALEFGAALYVHNIQVSFLAFGLGALTIVFAHVLLFQNGVILGAVAAQYMTAGAHAFFLAWVGPHGALELPAIIIGAAAGTKLGQAMLLPGDRTRRESVRLAAPAACRLLGAAAALLVVAGLVEGSFSQMTARTVPFELKIGVAVLLFAGLLTWIVAGGQGAESEDRP